MLETRRQDDPSLSGNVTFWRRIPPASDRLKRSARTGKLVPSSYNFRDRNDELSVFVAGEATVEEVLASHHGFGLVQLSAADVRTIVPAAIICRDPAPHPAHALICGKISVPQAKLLAEACTWVREPALGPS